MCPVLIACMTLLHLRLRLKPTSQGIKGMSLSGRLRPFDECSSHFLVQRHMEYIAHLGDRVGKFFFVVMACDRSLALSPDRRIGMVGISPFVIETTALSCSSQRQLRWSNVRFTAEYPSVPKHLRLSRGERLAPAGALGTEYCDVVKLITTNR